jgi:hypothetical protein
VVSMTLSIWLFYQSLYVIYIICCIYYMFIYYMFVYYMFVYYLWLQVLSAATVVAKHTSALCNACRLASSKTDNPVAKRHFVQSAKDVANSTANLVKAIKVSSVVAIATMP